MQQLPLKVHYKRFVEQITNRATVDPSFLIPCLIPLPCDVHSQSYCKNVPHQSSQTTNGFKKKIYIYFYSQSCLTIASLWQQKIKINVLANSLCYQLNVTHCTWKLLTLTPPSTNNWWATNIMKEQRQPNKTSFRIQQHVSISDQINILSVISKHLCTTLLCSRTIRLCFLWGAADGCVSFVILSSLHVLQLSIV